MWIINSTQGRLYTVFKKPITKGMTMKTEKNLAEKVAVVRSESRGIGAAIAKLMRRQSVIDIIEQFQTRHALQEEHEMKNFNASTDGASTQGVPDKDGMLKNGIFETQKSINTNQIQINREK
jgi:hypothetical protein